MSNGVVHRLPQKPQPAKAVQSFFEACLSKEMSQALNYIVKIYGTLVSANLYSNYEIITAETCVGLLMDPVGAKHSMRHWMSFEHHPQTDRWQFHYRGLSKSDNDLCRLAEDVHRLIANYESRTLTPLLIARAKDTGSVRRRLSVV